MEKLFEIFVFPILTRISSFLKIVNCHDCRFFFSHVWTRMDVITHTILE